MSEDQTTVSELPGEIFCPACHFGRVQPSKRRQWRDSVAALVGLKPFRCQQCSHRFYARIKAK